MPRRWSALLLGLGLALASFSPGSAGKKGESEGRGPVLADPTQMAADEQALQAAAQADDAPAALEFFRKRTPSEAQRQRLRGLIADLGADSFQVRKKASTDLIASGPIAVAGLRAATRSPDAEVAHRAQACLAALHHGDTAPLVLSGVRLILKRQPAGAIAILTAYCPYAEEQSVADAIRAALVAQAARAGKPEPALLQLLENSDPEQRTSAAVILARANLDATRDAVQRLLKDDDATVRLRVGRALLEAGDREAIPVLIDLFGDLTGDDRWDIEELLERVAGANAPAIPRNDADTTRRRRLASWRAWWQLHGQTVPLSRLTDPPRAAGRLFVIEADLLTSDGQVVEIGPDGAALHRINGLQGPIAAQPVATDRLLIAEYAGRRIGERTLDGKSIWEKELPANPVAVQRLANGNTFVACRNRLLEIDRQRKEVWQASRPVRDVVGARKHADGSMVLLTDDGSCRWLDATGREVSRFSAPGPHVMGTGLDLLPNKRVLVPSFGLDRVTEYDALGNVLWEAAVPGPASAERLPNGHTLVGCTMPPLVVELDRLGQVVWRYQPQQALIQATRRGGE